MLVWWAEPQRIGASLLRTHPAYLILALAVNLLAVIPAVWRWQLVSRLQDMVVSLRRLFTLYMVSIFFNNFLPTSFGGDVVRVYGLSAASGKPVQAALSVLADRLIGVLALALIALGALPFARRAAQSSGTAVAIALVTCAALVATILLFSRPAHERAATWAEHVGWLTLASSLRDSAAAMGACRRDRRLLLAALFAAFLMQGLLIVSVWLLCRAVGERVMLSSVAVHLPLITVLTMLPISFNGIGVQDAGFVWLFGQTGTPAAAAASVSLLWHFARLLMSLPGFPLYLANGLRGLPTDSPEGGNTP
jgi:uncharacterized protein (TIRG00374 family)